MQTFIKKHGKDGNVWTKAIMIRLHCDPSPLRFGHGSSLHNDQERNIKFLKAWKPGAVNDPDRQ